MSLIIAITEAVLFAAVMLSNIKMGKKRIENLMEFNNKMELNNKNLNYILLVSKSGDDIKKFFDSQGWYKVAVYGMNSTGNMLISILIRAGIDVSYGIDKNPDVRSDYVKVLRFDQIKTNTDVIIVVPEQSIQEICDEISKFSYANIVKMSSLLEEILLLSHK